MSRDGEESTFLARINLLALRHQELLGSFAQDGQIEPQEQETLDRISRKLDKLRALAYEDGAGVNSSSAADGETGEATAMSGDWKAPLTKEFTEMDPDLRRLLEICIPDNKAALQRLTQAFETELQSEAANRSREALTALKIKMQEIVAARAEGQRRRGPKLARVKERAQALRVRLDQLNAETGST